MTSTLADILTIIIDKIFLNRPSSLLRSFKHFKTSKSTNDHLPYGQSVSVTCQNIGQRSMSKILIAFQIFTLPLQVSWSVIMIWLPIMRGIFFYPVT